MRGRSPDGSQQWLNWIVRRTDTGQAVGTVQATVSIPSPSEQRRSTELAWIIVRPHQQCGYAREAAQIMATWLPEHGSTYWWPTFTPSTGHPRASLVPWA